jgi:hypothetical protein
MHTQMACLYGELGELYKAAEGASQRLPVRHAHLVVAEPAHQPVEILHVAHGGGEVLHVLGVLRTREESQRLLPVGDNFCTTEPSKDFLLVSGRPLTVSPVAGLLAEPYSQLTPLSGAAVQARQSTYIG